MIVIGLYMDALAIVRLIIRVNRKPSRNDAMPGSKDAKEANAHNVLEGGSASGAQAEEAQVDPSFENEYDQGPAADQPDRTDRHHAAAC